MHAYLFITKGELTDATIKKNVLGFKRIIPFTIAKIADAKELIRQTSTSFSEKTLYLLPNFDNSSIEAQNAFLKCLEEAQENLIFVLGAKKEEAVLSTIVSRCQVIRVKPPFASKLRRGRERVDFSAISKITKREDAIAYLENLISSLHKDLPENVKTLKYADEALARIRANANPTLQLTKFLVHL